MTRTRLWRPSIEFNLTEHCNLRCEHCDQASSLLPTKYADLASFRRDLEALSEVLEAGEIKIGGGEALLHPEVSDFLRVAREVGIAHRVVLLTNGVLLHRAPPEIWDLIEGMWISVYPGVTHRFDWDWVQEMADQHEVWVWRKETPEFAQRLLVDEVQSERFTKMVFQNCAIAHFESCHTIYEGRYYLCSPSVWTEPRLALRGVKFENRGPDSVPIHGNPNLHDDLDTLIRRQEPLDACRYCLGTWARSTTNVQMTRKDRTDAMTKKSEPLDALVDPEIIVPRAHTEQQATTFREASLRAAPVQLTAKRDDR